MKVVLYTQRVEIIKNYGERRDCADQRISEFLSACGYVGIPLPNVCNNLSELVIYLKPVGILLTGGNSLLNYGGNAEERDRTDKNLIQIALEQDIPLYGFCRGMQSILDYFGNSLEKVTGHVASRHILEGKLEGQDVNSYHNEATTSVKKPLLILATAPDGVVESIGHENRKIQGSMWHPERELPFKKEDVERIQKIFG